MRNRHLTCICNQRKGNIYGQENAARLYCDGRVVKQDYDKAASSVSQGGRPGRCRGQRYLGQIYENGNGVKQNYEDAELWYRKAADKGDAMAKHYLGHLYEKGLGVARDAVKAIRWYNEAGRNELADASPRGTVYCEGVAGLPKDYAEALKWYQKAADKGFARRKMDWGCSTPTDWALSKTTAKRGYRSARPPNKAMQRRRAIWETCTITAMESADPAKADSWYAKAGNKNTPAAMFRLATLYRDGSGVEQSDAMAASRSKRPPMAVTPIPNISSVYYTNRAKNRKRPRKSPRMVPQGGPAESPARKKVAEPEKTGQAGANLQPSASNATVQPGHAQNMLGNGMNLLKLGNIDGAKAMFRNAVRLDPSLKPKVDEALANTANRCEGDSAGRRWA